MLERSRLQAQLMEHAYHDSLTGSPTAGWEETDCQSLPPWPSGQATESL